ncbi:hypothetical protein PHYSODRAFT_307982 [Phytophthora sojae]|uniref:Uncharacterized protein n=1 Tax=Phytophthora sojae (strain P6497) TaxID=1094619 RepID=G5AHD9_PHYSP|nr:hypothetical protein PHYSODRAFT_307982 [Phytophthora sojae]EGZ05117.1 hypothetical protein PHYSODRAFT_307982 [Phytophthora sojae]|eukprot:XP_009539489.1 hypothetical protein PHYSODRAFT_307982 [Phytophthora sojae]
MRATQSQVVRAATEAVVRPSLPIEGEPMVSDRPRSTKGQKGTSNVATRTSTARKSSKKKTNACAPAVNGKDVPVEILFILSTTVANATTLPQHSSRGQSADTEPGPAANPKATRSIHERASATRSTKKKKRNPRVAMKGKRHVSPVVATSSSAPKVTATTVENKKRATKKTRRSTTTSSALPGPTTQPYRAVGGFPTTVNSYVNSGEEQREPTLPCSETSSSSDSEIADDDQDILPSAVNDSDRDWDSQSRTDDEQRRPETPMDVNICGDGDRNGFDALDSDGPSDEGEESHEENIRFVDTGANWTDAAIAEYMAELGADINDDDALLKLARTRNEIKAWETNGWEEGNYITVKTKDVDGTNFY